MNDLATTSEPNKAARHALARHREVSAIELRSAGESYESIARSLGVSVCGAWKIVARGLDRLLDRVKYDGARLRAIELHRLAVLQAVMHKHLSSEQVEIVQVSKWR